MHPALIILLCMTAGLLAIVPFVYLQIKQTGKTRLMLPAPESSFGNQHRTAESHQPWADHFGFEWIGGYTFRSLQKSFIAAWRHSSQPVFFLMEMGSGSTHYHFISAFGRKEELTTTSNNAIVIPRPPGDYVQRFPDASLTELFMQHVQAHDLLLQRGYVKLAPYPLRVDRALINALGRQYAHVTAIKAWPLRALLWVLVEPRRWAGRDITAQLEDLPPPTHPPLDIDSLEASEPRAVEPRRRPRSKARAADRRRVRDDATPRPTTASRTRPGQAPAAAPQEPSQPEAVTSPVDAYDEEYPDPYAYDDDGAATTDT